MLHVGLSFWDSEMVLGLSFWDLEGVLVVKFLRFSLECEILKKSQVSGTVQLLLGGGLENGWSMPQVIPPLTRQTWLETPLQMTLWLMSKSHLKSPENQLSRSLSGCHFLHFAWIGRFLVFYSISVTKVPACVGENSINQLSLVSLIWRPFLLWIHFQLLVGKHFYIFFKNKTLTAKCSFLLLFFFLAFASRNSRCCT